MIKALLPKAFLLYTFLAFQFFIARNIFGQNENIQQNKPLSYEASYLGDMAHNFSGGLKKGSAYLGMANLRLTIDSRAAGLWKGGTFFINAAHTHGGMPAGELTGDFQGISNIESGNLTYLHELWYRQTIGSVSVIAGLQDLCAEFASSDYGSLFLNGSFGIHSTIADNIPAPIFPLTALGAQIQFEFSESASAKVAAFDGHPDDFSENPYNISWDLNNRDGILTVTEFDLSAEPIDGLEGTYKLGAYYHNHMARTDEEGELVNKKNYGFYLVMDQLVLNTPDGTRLALFTQASVSPYSINQNNYYLGAGVSLSGFFESRPDDILGFAAARAGFHGRLHNNETTLELSYLAQLNKNISIQPDFQYIMNPSGTDRHLRNALAGILRFAIGL